jgi:hypothetical protein
MKSRLLVLFCLFLGLLGCSKDQNQSGPTIKLKSYTSLVNSDGAFNAVLTYSQKSGNLSGDSLWIIRHRYNETPIPGGEETPDTLMTLLPDVPNANSAEFSASLAWANISYGINGENDTFDFKFVLVDIKGNHSDTVTTGKVVVLQ